jgi:transketolase
MTTFSWSDLDERAVKMAKALSADAVEKAGHGHPGSPISLAPVAYTLYQHFIKHDPNDPNWAGRDRFILSGGHASLTQYVQLYFSGYGLTLDDIKKFRQGIDTRTPGHPEFGLTPGIEMTTGPLGQGLASAVGFAYGQRYERGLLDPDAPAGTSPFDHKVWVIAGEGDVEEGVSSEASSLAGNQKLGNLTVIFDANHIQIEGDTKISFGEDILKRYEAYGWYTDEISFVQPDGSYKEDTQALAAVLEKAEKVTDRPKLIKVDSLIAWPTPGKTNDESSHGSKLGEEAVAGLKKVLGLDPSKNFQIDEEALAHAREVAQRGLQAHSEWDKKFDEWKSANPDKAALYDRIKNGTLPEGFDKAIDDVEAGFAAGDKVATRKASGAVINAIAAVMPELWGGSADLGGSNNTTIKGADSFAPKAEATKTWPERLRIRPRAALRRARVRDGSHHQRHPARLGHPSVRWHVLPVLRLRASGGAPRRADGDPEPLRVDPRFRGPGRGRPDAPADRAPGRLARHTAVSRSCARRTSTRPTEAYRATSSRRRTRTAHGHDPDPSGRPGARRDRLRRPRTA